MKIRVKCAFCGDPAWFPAYHSIHGHGHRECIATKREEAKREDEARRKQSIEDSWLDALNEIQKDKARAEVDLKAITEGRTKIGDVLVPTRKYEDEPCLHDVYGLEGFWTVDGIDYWEYERVPGGFMATKYGYSYRDGGSVLGPLFIPISGTGVVGTGPLPAPDWGRV